MDSMNSVPADDSESLEATLELLADPDAQARIARSEREINGGESLALDELRGVLEAAYARHD